MFDAAYKLVLSAANAATDSLDDRVLLDLGVEVPLEVGVALRAGVVLREGRQSLTLQAPDGQKLAVDVANLDKRTTPTSPMPSVEKTLTPRDARPDRVPDNAEVSYSIPWRSLRFRCCTASSSSRSIPPKLALISKW